MRRSLLPILLLLLAPLASPGASEPDVPRSADIGADELRGHVKILASDEYEGRRSGAPGGERAAAYVAARFEEIGLEPAGDDGTFLQRFELPMRRLVRAESALAVRAGEAEPVVFEPGEDWEAFPTSAAGDLEGAGVVFAGYGITAPDLGWDDYADIDVAGKVVLVLRHGPREGRPGYRYSGRNRRYLTFDRKVLTAAEAGAAAVILVNDRFHHADDPDVLQIVNTGREAPVPFVFAKAEVARALLSAAGLSFDAVQREIDEKAAPRSRALPGIRLDLKIRTAPLSTANVVGLLPGSDPELASEVVVVGAHYDHVGTDGMGALDPQNAGAVRNGADDNASGTSGVIEVAEHFALAKNRPARSMIFVAFAAEELGLLGSAHYVEHPAVPNEKTVAMLNMDMIGRSRDDEVFIGGTGTSPVLDGILDSAEKGLGLKVQRSEGGVAPSDNTSFFRKNVPALFFFTGIHPDYHRATDDWDKLNYEAQAKILVVVARTARALADLPEKPPFVANTGRSRSGVWLGVQLGPAPDGGGVALGSVVPGSPAEKAGLRAGDVVRAIGDAETDGPQALIRALQGRKPGDNVTIRILRDGEELELPVTLGSR